MSRYPDDSFDIVLVFGSLYHLHSEADKDKCIAEAKRVCKPEGKLFFAFITNDMIILTEFAYRPDYFENGDYDKETFRPNDFPFVFLPGCGAERACAQRIKADSRGRSRRRERADAGKNQRAERS